MTHGVDTDFLVAVEVAEHPYHGPANALLSVLLERGSTLAVAPQTLAEFIHVVTDARRMPMPLSTSVAVARAKFWWQAQQVVRVFPDGVAVSDFLAWLVRHRLGRKRLLDTMLAATFHRVGVRRIITNSATDYEILGAFECMGYRE
jgi:predicted nucleic acid-binding protein